MYTGKTWGGNKNQQYSAHWINSSWVALEESRGIETPDHKVFMRNTAIISEILTYFIPLYIYCNMVTDKTKMVGLSN